MTRLLPIAAAIAMLAGCGVDPPCDRADLSPLPARPRWAVLTSDFVSSAVALLDAEGALSTEAWLDSGTTSPGLSTALSGDASLPTAPIAGELVIVDRFGSDVVTRIAIPGGGVLAQHPTTLPAAGLTGYRSNPHDVVAVAGGLWVSRHEPNLDPAAPPLDRGDDLVFVTGSGPTEAIALSHLGVDAGGVRAHARPARLVRAGPRLVVGLARLSLDFTVAGPGAVAIVDLEVGAAEALAIDGASNCGQVAPVPGEADAAVVLCAGPTFADEAERRAGAALAFLRVGPDGAGSVERVLRPADHAWLPTPSHGLAPLGGGRVAMVARGEETAGLLDRLVVVDAEAGTADEVLTGIAFSLGEPAWDVDRGVLLVPDALAGVHLIDLATGADRVLDVSPCRGLPAREVRAL